MTTVRTLLAPALHQLQVALFLAGHRLQISRHSEERMLHNGPRLAQLIQSPALIENESSHDKEMEVEDEDEGDQHRTREDEARRLLRFHAFDESDLHDGMAAVQGIGWNAHVEEKEDDLDFDRDSQVEACHRDDWRHLGVERAEGKPRERPVDQIDRGSQDEGQRNVDERATQGDFQAVLQGSVMAGVGQTTQRPQHDLPSDPSDRTRGQRVTHFVNNYRDKQDDGKCQIEPKPLGIRVLENLESKEQRQSPVCLDRDVF